MTATPTPTCRACGAELEPGTALCVDADHEWFVCDDDCAYAFRYELADLDRFACEPDD